MAKEDRLAGTAGDGNGSGSEELGLAAGHAKPVGLARIAALSDDELIGRTRALVRDERRLLAELVAHLAEMDARRLYARFAASSLFDYCVRELGFSEPQAFLRIRAARAVRRHPRLLQLIATGALHLSGVKLIAPELEAGDADQLIELACGKTCREIEALLAERRPRPSVSEAIRKLPTTCAGNARQGELGPSLASAGRAQGCAASAIDGPERSCAWSPGSAAEEAVGSPRTAMRAVQPAIERPQPLGGDRFKVVFTADGRLVGLLEELRALYSHREPNAELATIVGDAAKMLRDALLKQRFGLGAQPRKKKAATTRHRSSAGASRAEASERKTTSGSESSERKASAGASGSESSERKTASGGESSGRKTSSGAGSGGRVVSRHIPLAVRREVFRRDEGRCGYVDENGERCGARGWLELHHCDPWARGGAHSVENLAVRCRAHNTEAARRALLGENTRRRVTR